MTVSPPTGIWHWVPGAWVIRRYQREWLTSDLVAGAVLTALLVPQGMAYAELAGLPPVTGLYTTIACLVAYAIFGPSRILMLGPDSALGPLIAAVILPLAGAGGDPSKAIALAGALACMVGAIAVVAGVARLGYVTDLLSMPVRVGYLNGIAIVIVMGQLPKLFGFSVDSGGLLREAAEFVRGVADGRTNATALALGVGSMVVIVACRLWAPRTPGVLLAVIGSIVVVAAFGLTSEGISVVGVLPQGLPTFSIPSVPASDLMPLFAGALGIAFVSLADTSATSQAFAARNGYTVDPNQELIGVGGANVAAGLLQGFPVSSSASRTAVAERSGAKTEVTGLVGAALICALLLFAPSLVQDLPSAVLAAIVIVAATSLVEIGQLKTLLRVRRRDFGLSIACTLGVAFFGVLWGIAIAIGLSLADFVWRAWHPYDAVLGRIQGRKGYHDGSRHPEARQVPGLLLYRFDAPLFFANANVFRTHVRHLVRDAEPPVIWLVVAAEPITDVDTTAAEMLWELDEDLEHRGIELAFAEMKGPVKDRLERYGLRARVGAERFYPTVGTAVKAYLEHTGEPWVDWEEAPWDEEGSPTSS
jgi:high affinity sulfate transporter 1